MKHNEQRFRLSDDRWKKIESGEIKYIFTSIDDVLKSGECLFHSIDDELYTATSYCIDCDDGEWDYNCGLVYRTDSEDEYKEGKVWKAKSHHPTSKSKKCGDKGIFTTYEPMKVFGTKHITLVEVNTIPSDMTEVISLDKGKDFLVYKISDIKLTRS